ncbi:MAG: ribonuclease HII [Alphaproteobacteria bacterium]|nr:ribonuclease HII [Alphaproteobacteria bacterium]
MPDFNIEKSLNLNGLIAGFDEAGRGPWCGPVVAACVCWPDLQIPEELANAINDSKKLTAKKREALFPKIMASNAIVGVGQASAEEIDDMNILQASFLAMHRALDEVRVKGYNPIFGLIDGNRLPAWDIPCQAVIGGDGKSLSIGAASIIAKVVRDRLMADLAKEFPAYGWERNAGYGTAEHIQALKEYGPTIHHRKSYAPIKKILEGN